MSGIFYQNKFAGIRIFSYVCINKQNTIIMNKSAQTQSFFSQVVTGENDTHKPNKPFRTFEHFPKGWLSHLNPLDVVFKGFAGDFDEHIACSIPTFRECQLNKAYAIQHVEDTGGYILDIGGSEGTFLKTLGFVAPDLFCVNLEPNKDMKEAFEGFKPNNCHIVDQAFLEGFEDIEAADIPDNSFDVVNETMTFQFIKKDRENFVKEVKRVMKTDGVFFTEEKFKSILDYKGVEYKKKESNKDLNHKSLYFTEDQLKAKTDEVLVGMSELQADREDYRKTLEENFMYVYPYWTSGNFGGFLCTNCKDVFDLYVTYLDANLVYGHIFK